MYAPRKYFSGLSKTQKKAKLKEMKHFGAYGSRDPRAYTGFKTDTYVKSKTSNYTRRFKKQYPDALSLEEKAKATGIPLRFLRTVYNRGMAAWRTGHRPGATEQQWGYARVHSFVLKGKTYHTTDSDVARKVADYMEKRKAK
jgi:hypothetical protein